MQAEKNQRHILHYLYLAYKKELESIQVFPEEASFQSIEALSTVAHTIRFPGATPLNQTTSYELSYSRRNLLTQQAIANFHGRDRTIENGAILFEDYRFVEFIIQRKPALLANASTPLKQNFKLVRLAAIASIRENSFESFLQTVPNTLEQRIRQDQKVKEAQEKVRQNITDKLEEHKKSFLGLVCFELFLICINIMSIYQIQQSHSKSNKAALGFLNATTFFCMGVLALGIRERVKEIKTLDATAFSSPQNFFCRKNNEKEQINKEPTVSNPFIA